MSASIFNDLFVLELANNHWGKLDRGLKIVSDFARVVRFNDVHAAIKLQFRDVVTMPTLRTASTRVRSSFQWSFVSRVFLM